MRANTLISLVVLSHGVLAAISGEEGQVKSAVGLQECGQEPVYCELKPECETICRESCVGRGCGVYRVSSCHHPHANRVQQCLCQCRLPLSSSAGPTSTQKLITWYTFLVSANTKYANRITHWRVYPLFFYIFFFSLRSNPNMPPQRSASIPVRPSPQKLWTLRIYAHETCWT